MVKLLLLCFLGNYRYSDHFFRPKQRNAWTEVMRNELIYCIEKANKIPEVKVIIITGDPEGKAFCFGADLSPPNDNNPLSIEGDAPEGKKTDIKYFRDGGGQVGLAILNSLKPVIAAVNGSAVGVGLTLPTVCDITIVSESAKLGYVFAKRGLTMECLSSFILTKVIGYKHAMELVLTGRIFSPKDAPSGLFNHVVPQDKVLSKALEIAKEITETSAMSAMLDRNMIIRNSYGISPEEAHLIESKAIFYSLDSPDTKEGMKAFFEKRKASYKLDPKEDAPVWFPFWIAISTKSKL